MQRNLLIACLAVSSLAAPVLEAHVFPITYGTLLLDKGEARLRLRISVHNLHPALEAFMGGHLEMKDEGYGATLLEAYFKGRLELVPSRGRAVSFRVVGQETGIEEIVITLVVPLKQPRGWQLRNTVLFEQSPGQKNYLTVERGGHRLGLTFDAEHPLLPLSAP